MYYCSCKSERWNGKNNHLCKFRDWTCQGRKKSFISRCRCAGEHGCKVLYGLMLDRMSLSLKNKWFDEQNRAYIIFTIEDVMELLNCKSQKAVKIMKELDAEEGIGLIEKIRQGFGKPNIIYVKNFMIKEAEEQQQQVQQNELPKNCENQNSVIRNIENQEVNLLSKEELCKRQNQIRWMSFCAIF